MPGLQKAASAALAGAPSLFQVIQFKRRQSFRHAENRASRARIIHYLIGAGFYRFADRLDGGFMIACANRLLGWTNAGGRFTFDELFDDPVFERVKANDREPSSR